MGRRRGASPDLPRGRDLLAAPAVAGDPYRAGVEEHDGAVGWPPPEQVAVKQPAPVSLRVLASQPGNDPAPDEGAEVVEGLLAGAVAKVGAPAAQHRVEAVHEPAERPVGAAARDLPDLGLDARERALARVGVHVAAAGAPPFS